MNPDRFTIKSREAIAAALEMAQHWNHQEVGSEHLLLTLIDQDGGLVLPILRKAEVPVATIRESIKERFSKRPRVDGGQVHFSGEANNAFREAEICSKEMGDEYRRNIYCSALAVQAPVLSQIFCSNTVWRRAPSWKRRPPYVEPHVSAIRSRKAKPRPYKNTPVISQVWLGPELLIR